MILKSFEFQCDFDFDFQITTSKMIWILILNHLYLGDLILILKSSTYDDFAHLWVSPWNTVPSCLRVMLVLLPMLDSSQASQVSQS